MLAGCSSSRRQLLRQLLRQRSLLTVLKKGCFLRAALAVLLDGLI